MSALAEKRELMRLVRQAADSIANLRESALWSGDEAHPRVLFTLDMYARHAPALCKRITALRKP